MTVRSEARNQFLCDVFTTAFEGGVNYWADVQAYRWQDREADGTFYGWLVDSEDEDAEAVKVDIAVIARGFGKFFQWVVDRGFGKDHYYWQAIEANSTNGDDGDYDAIVADIIVQLGLFGEVVYG